ncbi:hypothetical protein ACHWQZ_G003050 [Mnemiopsis leidyi]
MLLSSLVGKTAIVTGGGTGIGKGITELLVKQGCKVAIASRSLQKVETAAQEFNHKYKTGEGHVIPYQCDIRKSDQVEEMLDSLTSTHGPIDYLVNNGGGQFIMPAEMISPNGWDAVVNTNLRGTFFLTQSVFKKCMKENGGSIVNILMELHGGWPGFAHSVSARAGVEALSKTLAVEWGEYGVSVNNVIPGIIYSDTAVQNYGPFGPKMFREAKKQVPVGRLGTPEDIAVAVVFMLTAPYVTGHSLVVDGGSSLGTVHWWNTVNGMLTGKVKPDDP